MIPVPIRDRPDGSMGRKMGQDNEASVEEILESIKKVIARDNRAGAMEARRRRMLVSEDDAAEPAPLIRTHKVRDAEEVLDLGEIEGAIEVPPHTAAQTPAVPLEATEDTPLIADQVLGAMQENLAALAMLAEPPARPQIVRSGETSLEGLTRELLRPMLAEWLEANLPAMVESLVQAEIARIVGKRR